MRLRFELPDLQVHAEQAAQAAGGTGAGRWSIPRLNFQCGIEGLKRITNSNSSGASSRPEGAQTEPAGLERNFALAFWCHPQAEVLALAGTWFLFWGARAVGPLVQEGCLELFGGVAGGFGIV